MNQAMPELSTKELSQSEQELAEHLFSAYQTHQPLLQIMITGNSLYSPHAEICQISEEKRNRKLHQLYGMIFFSQDQDLQEDKEAVHDDGGCPHS